MSVFIGLYIILALICFAYWFSRNRQEGIFRLTVILFLPVLGYLLFFFLWLKESCSEKGEIPEYLQYQGENAATGKKGMSSSFSGRALELVPMEEALLLNDIHSRRKQLLDVLKSDMSKYPAMLKMALSNEDTETSHYAAAGIVEIKRKLLQSVQESKSQYESSRDRSSLIAYAYALKAYQGSGLLDETSARKAMEVYQGIIKEAMEYQSLDSEFFIDCINYEIDAGRYELAGLHCKRFMEEHRQEEQPYVMYLKLFYQSGDRERFRDMLKLVEGSTISLTCDTWRIIKFWMEVYS